MSSKSRNRTKSTANTAPKANQPPRQPAQPAKGATSASSKPAPAPAKVTPPQAAKLTPSARLRQEWDKFESWLSLQRAEKDKRINEKLKEVMSKSTNRKVSTASESTGIGAFEDKLNEELADKAREEWFKRLEVEGLDPEDWTDISPAEMEAVEAAFTPQRRPTQAAPPPPAVPVQAEPSKASFHTKPAKNPYAATVEDVPLPPGAWNTPSKTPVPSKGVIGRARPESPLLTRIGTPNSVSIIYSLLLVFLLLIRV
jgi:hypothetical protein